MKNFEFMPGSGPEGPEENLRLFRSGPAASGAVLRGWLLRGLVCTRFRRVPLDRPAVAVYQVVEQVSIDEEQNRQGQETIPAVQIHGLNHELGGHKADEQAEEKGKDQIHSTILPN